MEFSKEVEVPKELEEQFPDRVADGFTGKTVFITGGTGFLGKVLVEKILRRCSDVKKIYLLVRTKKGKDPNERIKEQFNGAVSSLSLLFFSFL